MGTDEHKKLRIKKLQEQSGQVGVSVKTDLLTHSGSSELSLDSESKLEPSVAKARLNLAQLN